MSNAGTYDIAIVGAGMAGSALACALCTDEFASSGSKPRVALVEARELRQGWPPVKPVIDGYDARVSALTVASQQFLERIGVWPSIANQRVSPFSQMHVWDADGTGSIHFDAAEVRSPVLGHIVENRVTAAALINFARAQNNIDIIDGVAVESMTLAEKPGEPGRLCLADGRQLDCDLVVAADGAVSPMRELAGLETREWDYAHNSIVCTVQTSQPHQNTAWQRFTPNGPLAFLPLSAVDAGDSASEQHFCSIVWSQTRDEAECLMALDDAAFIAALESAFERRLGSVIDVSKRFAFPLRQRHAVNYVRQGFALVADAAHTIHPLAGQGINLGLADVNALSDCLARAFVRGQHFGDVKMLLQYQRERKGDNLAMMAAVEGFKRLFEQAPLPLRWLRNAGMKQVDQHKLLKNMIIKYAMGVA